MLKGCNTIKRFLLTVILPISIVVGLLPAHFAFADVNNFTVTDFSADYYLTNNDPQGTLHVIEHIAVNFTDQNHGILRAIPSSYQGHTLQLHINTVSSPSGAPAQYTTYGQNSNAVLKIGDPNQTVTGNQQYVIDYTMNNVINFYGDHDELYWNANGDQWGQPFTKVTAILHIPQGLRLSSQGVACYAGQYGSSGQCQTNAQGTVVTYSAANLGPNETLTFVAGFQKGFFAPAGLLDNLRDNAGPIAQLLIPIVVLGGGGFLWWFRRGRDAKGTGIIVPQYDAPDGMTPLEVGTLMNFSTTNRELTATLIDLAIRKYFRIVEVTDNRLSLIAQKNYRLDLLNTDWSALNLWEKELMGGLFGDQGQVASVDLKSMATKLNAVATQIKNQVDTSLTEQGYFTVDPSKYISISLFTILGIAIFALLRMGFFSWTVLGVAIGGVAFMAFFHAMPARTAKGVAAKEHIEGLKLFLTLAEKDRIAMLQSPDAPYAPKTAGPEHTVQLFEKLLPYAIVLRVEQEWAKQFADLYATPPDWYSGNVASFNTGYLVGSLSNNFSGAVSNSFAAPRSSSGSGFGGGFAGGGGGGGGGGGW